MEFDFISNSDTKKDADLKWQVNNKKIQFQIHINMSIMILIWAEVTVEYSMVIFSWI